MQAIIPVAGAGTRLRPLTYTQPKVLISVAGKPILSYIFDNLIALGVNRFVVVIGYLGEKIVEYVQNHYPNLQVEFVVQTERLGLGHAILCAQSHIDNTQPLIIQLGDTILHAQFDKIISSQFSTLCIKKVDDPRGFGIVQVDDKGIITAVEEKPAIPMSNLAIVGFYFIRNPQKLMQALQECYARHAQDNELTLSSGLQRMIENGEIFSSEIAEQWYDLGKRDILLETNANLLKSTREFSYGNAALENSIIIKPVSIGENTRIVNSIIGPNVTIGDHSVINHSILQNAIIGSYTKIEHIQLNDSLIGSDATIVGHSQALNIGDNTEINLSGNS
jgi:glucose-1-phosphate thymidylyltransferase